MQSCDLSVEQHVVEISSWCIVAEWLFVESGAGADGSVRTDAVCQQ